MTPNTPSTAADLFWPIVIGIVALLAVMHVGVELLSTREHLKRMRKRDEQRRFGLEKELERGMLLEAARAAARTETSRLLETRTTPRVEVQPNAYTQPATEAREAKIIETSLGRRRFLPLHKS